jgi:hypothetical protein
MERIDDHGAGGLELGESPFEVCNNAGIGIRRTEDLTQHAEARPLERIGPALLESRDAPPG